MKIVELKTRADFDQLRDAWNELLGQSASDTVFLTWEWASAWWTAYGSEGQLRLLLAVDDAGALRGIIPLRRDSVRRYGQNFPCLRFMTEGSNDSDYLDCIVARGHEEAVTETLRRYWRDDLRAGTVVLLNEIPDASPNLPLLKSASVAAGDLWTEEEVPCSTVTLPENWESYLGMLKPRFRTKVRSVLRNLESRTDIRFGFCSTPEDVQRLTPILFDLHTRRWNRKSRPGVFGWDLKRKFYDALSAVLLERGWLRFSWLEWKGRVLACQYGFVYGGVYSQLQEGYEPECEHWNPGVALRAWSIRRFVEEGVREYDFLAGVGRHKADWACRVKTGRRIALAARSPKTLLFCEGPRYEERAREAVKRVVPEKVLAARQAWKTGASPAGRWQLRDWTRHTAAEVYFRSGAPTIARWLRERYQLSVSAGATRPVLLRRTDPGLRILYYHRVNDRNDPFFPAISTDLFEQEMQYVARRYKVVSLAEALDRLETGSCEPLVAVTFDDGYQDNYRNAFPILQRYQIPATIFLATESLDSRDPIWFERLANALKKTDREFIDLELDLPRRFYLRTPDERLGANGEIFEHLRGMEDGTRRDLLSQLLKALAVVDETDCRDQMLTWEQVREMTRQGIGFGGHTVTHPFISRLSKERVMWEVGECKRRIEEELQVPADYFAYPNGREQDFGMWNKDLVRGAGYRAALTTIWGMNYRSTDRMELRRGGPWEKTAAMFASKLDWYQLVND